MKWKFDSDRPIYLQIVEQIELGIVSGLYPPGSALPSVRALAMDAAVNPNTMQKSMSELESRGLLHTQRTVGRHVTDDETIISIVRAKLAKENVERFLTGMKRLGFERKAAVELLRKSEEATPKQGDEEL